MEVVISKSPWKAWTTRTAKVLVSEARSTLYVVGSCASPAFKKTDWTVHVANSSETVACAARTD